MRVLVTTSGSAGHLGPLIPFAHAVREQGGDVLIAARSSHAAAVTAAGFAVWPYADADPAERSAVFASLGSDLGSDEANRRVVSELFAGLDTAAALPGVQEACAEWRPDVVVSESCEFAGILAAEAAGLPAVRVGVARPTVEARFLAALGPAMAPHRERLGLPADPGGERLHAPPYFTLSPAALDDPALPLPPGARRFRENGHHTVAPLPDWWHGSGRPARLPHARHGRTRDGLLPRRLPRGDRSARAATRARARHHGPRRRPGRARPAPRRASTPSAGSPRPT